MWIALLDFGLIVNVGDAIEFVVVDIITGVVVDKVTIFCTFCTYLVVSKYQTDNQQD